MNNYFKEYIESIDSVLIENPIVTLDKYMNEKIRSTITVDKLFSMIFKITQIWDGYRNHNIQLAIIIENGNFEENKRETIYEFDFLETFKSVKQLGEISTIIFVVNRDGIILEKKPTKQNITITTSINLSSEFNSVVLHLGIRGIDVIINGKVYSSENFTNQYSDLLDQSRRLGIEKYRELVEKFYMLNVMYDPEKKYFVRSREILKLKRKDTIEKFPKLLRTCPEELFQRSFVAFLREHCLDTVHRETCNNNNDRYDVMVLTNDDKIYVFEIKWLGCSITSEHKIFNNYNKSERALEGAAQLKDYVENAEKYKNIFMEYPIHCGILLIFDARDVVEEIVFPDEYNNYPQIDLSQIYSVEKVKPNACDTYAINNKK